MNKKIWICFLRDQWLSSLLYWGAVLCVILFYQFTVKESVEVIYPVMIALYFYLILLIVKGVSYFRFMSRIQKSTSNPQYNLSPSDDLQKEVNDVIQLMHKHYLDQIHALVVEHEAQNRFLSQWIHNLKTPISVINLMAEQKNNDEADKVFADISEENQKLHQSVEQLLSLIRLDHFSRDFVPEAIDLKEEVLQAINGMKNQFVMKHIFPKLDINAGDTMVFSDKKWNRMMMEQFLSNAIKYSIQPGGNEEKTSKNIWITLNRVGSTICLSIRDEGMGIPEHDRYRIFEPFFTGDNGRKVESATGIGLYIADLIAKKLGHRIEITSEIGNGSTFTIHY